MEVLLTLSLRKEKKHEVAAEWLTKGQVKSQLAIDDSQADAVFTFLRRAGQWRRHPQATKQSCEIKCEIQTSKQTNK